MDTEPTLPINVCEIERIVKSFTDLKSIKIEKLPDNIDTLSPVDAVAICQSIIEINEEYIKEINQARDYETHHLEQWKKEVRSIKDKATKDAAEAELRDHYIDLKVVELKIDLDNKIREIRKASKMDLAKLRQFDARAPRAPTPPPAATPTPLQIPMETPKIPIFKGDILEFQTFWQMFLSLVDNQPIHAVQKLDILKGKLEGEPKQLIVPLPSTEANYKVAKSLLLSTYDKKDRVQMAIWKKLLAIPQCKNREDVKPMFIQAESLIKQLEALKGEENNSEEILHMLEMKLHASFVDKILHAKEKSLEWNLKEFRAVMPKLIEHDDAFRQITGYDRNKAKNLNQQQPKNSQASSSMHNARYTDGNSDRSPAMAFTATNTQRPELCIFCRGKHFSKNCSLTPGERIKRIKIDKRCFKCLRFGHMARNCNAGPCRNCNNKNHHSFLCLNNKSQQRRCTNINEQNTPTSENEKSLDDVGNTAINATAPLYEMRTRTQMMTLVADVFQTANGDSTEVGLIIDPGSTYSYVSTRLCDKLDIRNGPMRKATIARLGENAGNWNINAPTAKIGLKGPGGFVCIIHAIKINTILPVLPCLKLEKGDLQRLQTTFPMELPHRHMRIEILLGMDYLEKIQLKYKQKLPSGLSHYETNLGPIICGTWIPKTEINLKENCEINSVAIRATRPKRNQEDPEVIMNKYLMYGTESIKLKPNISNEILSSALEITQNQSQDESFTYNGELLNEKILSKKQNCIFCHGHHRSYECHLPITTKKELIKNYRCFNCLREGHQRSECKIGPCSECTGVNTAKLHHPWLCPLFKPMDRIKEMKYNKSFDDSYLNRMEEEIASTHDITGLSLIALQDSDNFYENDVTNEEADTNTITRITRSTVNVNYSELFYNLFMMGLIITFIVTCFLCTINQCVKRFCSKSTQRRPVQHNIRMSEIQARNNPIVRGNRQPVNIQTTDRTRQRMVTIDKTEEPTQHRNRTLKLLINESSAAQSEIEGVNNETILTDKPQPIFLENRKQFIRKKFASLKEADEHDYVNIELKPPDRSSSSSNLTASLPRGPILNPYITFKTNK